MRPHASVRRIGDLAAAAGVTVDTVRYYEREGLLPPAHRTAGGTRLYTPDTTKRVQFIKQAQQLGLSLREVRQLLDPDSSRCSAVREVLAERLADVDRRLRDLTAFRTTLQNALERCDDTLGRSKSAPCPVVRQLETVRECVAGGSVWCTPSRTMRRTASRSKKKRGTRARQPA